MIMTNAIHAFKSLTLRTGIRTVVLAILGSLARSRPPTGLGRWSRLLVAAGVVLVISPSLLAMPTSAADTDVTFSVSNGVSAEDASYVTEGLALARSYVAETLS